MAHSSTTLMASVKAKLSGFLKNTWEWMKKHPIATGAIIGGLIVASVFSGGAALIPVFFAAFAGTAGVVFGALLGATVSCGIWYYISEQAYRSLDAQAAEDRSTGRTNPSPSNAGTSILAVILSVAGGIALSMAFPVAAVVLSGILITMIGSTIGAMLGKTKEPIPSSSSVDVVPDNDTSTHKKTLQDLKSHHRANSLNDPILQQKPIAPMNHGRSKSLGHIPYDTSPVTQNVTPEGSDENTALLQRRPSLSGL